MNIENQINLDIKLAMKKKEIDKLAALRSLKSAIILERTKDGRKEISDDIVLKIIAKMVKQRKDSIELYIKQSRNDLADEELNQLKHLEPYLPEQLSESEIRDIVREVVVSNNATSLSDLGRCMSILVNKIQNKADGSLISKILREELSTP